MLPLASANRLVPSETVAVLTAIAAATMFLGPLAAKGLEGWLASRPLPPVDSSGVATASGEAGEALVIGFGRFGQVVNQMLLAAERQVTVIDRNIDQIRTAERFGFKVFYGDGKRLDVLRAAGAEKAAVIAICVDDREAASTIAEMARRAFPQARLVVRAYDRTHALDLMQRGVRQPFRETFESALAFGREALQNLGLDENSAEAIRLDIRRRDIARLDRQRNEGMFAGMDLLHGTKLVPEPLREPGRKGAALAVPARPAPDAASEGATGQSS